MHRAELRALAQHADPQLSRLAAEALHALHRVEVRRAVLAGAEEHTLDAAVVPPRQCGDGKDSGLVRRLGPAPEARDA